MNIKYYTIAVSSEVVDIVRKVRFKRTFYEPAGIITPPTELEAETPP